MSPKDEAREALHQYHRALVANRTDEAVRIEQRFGLFGLPPMQVSLGLEAASQGLDPWDAIDQPMEKSE
jgi:hypothetical protein